jgi:GNAT superfamily N-acetyltransferase
MYQRLCDAQVKTGETVEIAVITPVDPAWTGPLQKLLGHKGPEWLWQVNLSLEGKTDALESRFYVARRGDVLVSHICTFEKDGIGLLGHVWTPPEERRKGLSSAILRVLMDDFRARGGRTMLLNTHYDTPPWHIYRNFGFEAYCEGSGCMRYRIEPDLERKYFARGASSVVDASWAAWPRLNLLVAGPEEFVKSIAYSKFYMDYVEDAYIYLMTERANNPRVSVRLLESDSTAAVVGYAWVVPDKRFPEVFLLDLYSHPNHPAGYGPLLEAIRWPAAKVQCYVEAGRRTKARALKSVGFSLEATLKAQIKKPSGPADLWIFSKDAHP